MPPNSSGHILLQELNIVELFDLVSLGQNTTECVHLMVEAKKLSFADREKFMADPNWVQVPIEGMLSKEYAVAQAKRIDPDRAAKDVPAGGPELFGDTTCFCVADRWGNVVSMLQSVQMGFGSGLIAGKNGGFTKRSHDLLALGGRPSKLPRTGETRPPYDEPCHRHSKQQSVYCLRYTGSGHAGSNQSPTYYQHYRLRYERPRSRRSATLAKSAKSNGIDGPAHLFQ